MCKPYMVGKVGGAVMNKLIAREPYVIVGG